ncbi:hypothetical protein D3C78_1264030 [compost metagenome]
MDQQLAVVGQQDILEIAHRGHLADRVDPLGQEVDEVLLPWLPVLAAGVLTQCLGHLVVVLRQAVDQHGVDQLTGLGILGMQPGYALQLAGVLLVAEHHLARRL